MANKNTAVFGIYATPATAENGVDHLLSRRLCQLRHLRPAAGR